MVATELLKLAMETDEERKVRLAPETEDEKRARLEYLSDNPIYVPNKMLGRARDPRANGAWLD